MKRFVLFSFVLGFLSLSHQVHADGIQNLTISPTEKYTLIQWDHVSDSVQAQTEGYALQWSQYLNKMRSVDPYTKLVKGSRNELSIFTSAVFEEAKTDYFYLRVYTYVKDGRQTILSNGSKILKFKFNYKLDKIIESEHLEPNDPVVSEDGVSSATFDFGKLRIVPYDTYATFSWSRPNLSRSDANGVLVVLSKKSDTDFSDPLVELSAGLDITSGKIEGLTPETEYITRGYFYKVRAGEKQKFGSGSTESFTTTKAMTTSQKARIERLRKRGLIRERALVTANVDGTSDQGDTETTDTPDEANEEETLNNTSSNYTRSEILKKIRSLEAELLQWKKKLNNTTTNARTTYSSKSRTKRTSYTKGDSGTLSPAMKKLCTKHPKLKVCNR
jgi:hypothetical protein